MRFKRDITYKKILSLFRSQNGSPFFNAKGLAIGVFSGCFPFFGFQTLMGVFFAKIVKLPESFEVSRPFEYLEPKQAAKLSVREQEQEDITSNK